MSALRLIKEVGASDMTLAPTWSRVRESNPPQRLGKPLYYRCTNPASFLTCLEGIIAEPFVKCNRNFSPA